MAQKQNVLWPTLNTVKVQCRRAKYHIVNPYALRESQRTQRVPTKAHQADKTAFQGHNKT